MAYSVGKATRKLGFSYIVEGSRSCYKCKLEQMHMSFDLVVLLLQIYLTVYL